MAGLERMTTGSVVSALPYRATQVDIQNQMKADALARFMTNNNMTEFWKDVKKNTNSNISLATNVNGSVRDTEIAEM